MKLEEEVFYWQTIDEKPTEAHIYSHTTQEESPGGTLTDVYVCICGEQIPGWGAYGYRTEWFKDQKISDVRKHQIVVCEECMKHLQKQE